METKHAAALLVAGSIACALVACGSKDTVPPLATGGGTDTVVSGAGSADSDASADNGDASGPFQTGIFDGGQFNDASVSTFSALPSPANVLIVGGLELFASCADGAVRSIGASGSVTKIASLARGGGAIASDGTALYAIVPSTTTSSADGSVVSINLTTGAETVLAANRTSPTALAISGSTVVFLDAGNGATLTVSSVAIGSAADDGGAVQTLTTFGSARAPGSLLLNGSTTYFTDGTTGQGDILAVGGTAAAQVLATVSGLPNGLALDATNLYFTTAGSSGTVQAIPRAGNAGARTLAMGQASPIGLQLVNGTLYWVEQTSGNLDAYDTAAGTVSVRGTGFAGATALAASDALYIALGSGQIVRLPI